MKRRPLTEINAGSMADIAFLLLIFWLVTTTIETDEGIKRQLPAWVEESQIKNSNVIGRNVFVVLVNANDELLVEDDYETLENLTKRTKEFLVANGDGITYPFRGEIPDLPIRQMVTKEQAELSLATAIETLRLNTDPSKDALFKSTVKHWEDALETMKYIPDGFAQLPRSAVISVRNDAGTSYDAYLQVQNELERAINELRDELSLGLFGESFESMELRYELNPSEELLLDRIYAVRAVYPYIISEAIESTSDQPN